MKNNPAPFEPQLNELLNSIFAAKAELPPRRLTLFAPIAGNECKSELMIVGRAPNGWANEFLPSDLDDNALRARIISSARQGSVAPDECPMSWVTRNWGAHEYVGVDSLADGSSPIHHRYNTARSAFWRVTRAMVKQLNIADVEAKVWPSTLIWSNLYKISPADGGNPSNKLCGIQEQICIDILHAELGHWQPKRLLFLTGSNWADVFLRGVNLCEHPTRGCFVQRAGTLRITSGCAESLFAVVPHPQGKPEYPLVTEACAALQSHRRI